MTWGRVLGDHDLAELKQTSFHRQRDAAVIVFCRTATGDARRWGWIGPAGEAGRRALAGHAIERIGRVGAGTDGEGVADVLVFQLDGEGELAGFGVGGTRSSGIHSWQVQRGRSFGDRLEDAVERVFARGYSRVVVVGTDVPDLKPAHLREAIESLGHREVVVGGDATGGCYLLGMRATARQVLKEIRWGSGQDFAGMLAAAKAWGGAAVLQDVLRDVDAAKDIAQLNGTDLPGMLRKALNEVLSRAFGTLLGSLRDLSQRLGRYRPGDANPRFAGVDILVRALVPTGPPM